jgi:hypothetical protein
MRIMGGGQQAQQQQQQEYQHDPRLLQYLSSVEQRLGGIAQQNEAAQLAQTHQILNEFAKGRPHFERVRNRMGALLQPDANGRAIVPLTPEGHVDLATAYDLAVRLDNELNEQMIAERISQEKRAASDAAAKARRAGISSGPTSPGWNSGASSNKQQAKQSVRQSIESAIASTRTGPRV